MVQKWHLIMPHVPMPTASNQGTAAAFPVFTIKILLSQLLWSLCQAQPSCHGMLLPVLSRAVFVYSIRLKNKGLDWKEPSSTGLCLTTNQMFGRQFSFILFPHRQSKPVLRE